MQKIKRYANRKLYDATAKKHVTYPELKQMIKEGIEVSIIDKESGEDITIAVLAKLIAHTHDDEPEQLSANTLKRIIQKGSDTVSDYARKYSGLWQSALSMAEDETEKLVNKLVKERELSESEGHSLKKEIMGYTENLKKWITDAIDKRIKEMMTMMNMPSRRQIIQLTDTIEALTEKVNHLENELKSAKKKAGQADKTNA